MILKESIFATKCIIKFFDVLHIFGLQYCNLFKLLFERNMSIVFFFNFVLRSLCMFLGVMSQLGRLSP